LLQTYCYSSICFKWQWFSGLHIHSHSQQLSLDTQPYVSYDIQDKESVQSILNAKSVIAFKILFKLYALFHLIGNAANKFVNLIPGYHSRSSEDTQAYTRERTVKYIRFVTMSKFIHEIIAKESAPLH
jgi:hypothetical protein